MEPKVKDKDPPNDTSYLTDGTLTLDFEDQDECEPLEQPTARGYKLVSRVGAGSFGEVWRAVQEATSQDVAIKFFQGSKGRGLVEEVHRLRDSTTHANVATLLDADFETDVPYLVMVFYPDNVERKMGKATSVSQACRWLQQLAAGLSHIHQTRTIHCDLKPANLLLDANDNIAVADFGQARTMADKGLWGTLGFMAPEQASRNLESPNVSWDVYAFGAVAYCILSGKLPRLDDVTCLEKVRSICSPAEKLALYRTFLETQPLTPLQSLRTDVDEELATIISSCLELEPEQRPVSMEVVLEDLQRREDGLPLLCRKIRRAGFRSRALWTDIDAESASMTALFGSWHRSRRRESRTSVAELSELGQKLLNAGEPLAAYDTLSRVVKRGGVDLKTKQRFALASARCGAWKPARKILTNLWNSGHNDSETGGLLARTFKDEWRQTASTDALASSQAHYQKCYEASRASGNKGGIVYTGVNAATTALFLGRTQLASEIATEVLRACQGQDDYWSVCSRGESLLVLGSFDEAAQSYQQAARLAGTEFGKLATTREQARLIIKHQGRSPRDLDALLPVPIVYLISRSGYGFEALNEAAMATIEREPDSILCMACLGELDVVFAERLVDHVSELRLVLPLPPEEMLESTLPEEVRDRARRLFHKASRLFEIGVSGEPFCHELVRFTEDVARGVASLRAESLCGQLVELEAFARPISKDVEPESGDRAICNFLFLRAKGLNELAETDFPSFTRELLRTVEKLASASGVTALKEDEEGWTVTFDSALSAALAASRLESELPLGLLLHAGPAFLLENRLSGNKSSVGHHAHWGSKVELLGPPHHPYASQAFAASLQAQAPEDFLVQYVGETSFKTGTEQASLFNLQDLNRPGSV